MRFYNVPKALGECYRQQEIMGGQQFFHLLIQPLLGFILLAVGAMAVATAAVDKMQVTAVAAFIHHGSKKSISVFDDIPDGFLMCPKTNLS